MQTGETLIEVKDLCKYFRGGTVRALNGVSLTVGKGDVIVIIGPSGSGKSTFLRSLNLLETPTSGSVIVEGTDGHHKEEERAGEENRSRRPSPQDGYGVPAFQPFPAQNGARKSDHLPPFS